MMGQLLLDWRLKQRPKVSARDESLQRVVSNRKRTFVSRDYASWLLVDLRQMLQNQK